MDKLLNICINGKKKKKRKKLLNIQIGVLDYRKKKYAVQCFT